jgi:glycerol-3-phosphate dehydrogenase
MVGPTETEYYGAPERAEPESEDVDYLLEALGEFFSSSGIEKNSVIASRAGVRPLYDNGRRSTGQVSRAYHIEWHGEGFLSVLGGKLTLHARAAAETVRAIKRELKFRARSPRPNEQLLPGADWKNFSEEMMRSVLLEMKVDEDSAHHLIRTYGSRAALFAEILAKEPALARRINSSLPHILAEATFSIRHEWAARAEDFFERRSDLALSLKAEGETLPADLNRFWRASAEDVV